MFAKYRSQDEELMAFMQFVGMAFLMFTVVKLFPFPNQESMLSLYICIIVGVIFQYVALMLLTKYFYRFMGNCCDRLCVKHGEKKGRRLFLLLGLVLSGGMILCLLILR